MFQAKLRKLITFTAAGTGIFAGICIYKGNEKFYNQILMPFISKYVPPERSHQLAVIACKYGLFSKSINSVDNSRLKTQFLGMNLDNPIGIAAGFDKQGEAVKGLYDIGFGFVEIGSITPEPQTGNPQPRVFRLTEDRAIINRFVLLVPLLILLFNGLFLSFFVLVTVSTVKDTIKYLNV